MNVYELIDYSQYNVKIFEFADSEWLQFVVDCRNGKDVYKDFDAVIGNVANDEVVKFKKSYEVMP